MQAHRKLRRLCRLLSQSMLHRQPNYISSRSYIDIAERFIDIGFWNVDMSTGEVRGTDGFFRMLGLPIGEPLTLHRWASMLLPEDREDFRSIHSIATMGESVTREVRLLDEHRPARWIRITVQGSGNDGCAAGIVQDIASERMSRATLHRERARLDAYIAMVGGIFWTRDVNGMLADLRGGEKMDGLDPIQLGGESWIEAVHPDDRALAQHRWSISLREGVASELSCRLLYADGVYRQVVARMAPARQENGAPIEWLGLIEETWRRDARASLPKGAATVWPQQLRAARVLLGWSVEELAREAGISTATVRRYETDGEHTKEATIAAILAAFEGHGLVMTGSSEGSRLHIQLETKPSDGTGENTQSRE